MEEGMASKRDIIVRLSSTFGVLPPLEWFIYFLSRVSTYEDSPFGYKSLYW